MRRKKPYFMVIDLFNLKDSVICSSGVSVSGIVGVHRNSIRMDDDGIYGHYLVLLRKIEK
jgi:hypothetical protein